MTAPPKKEAAPCGTASSGERAKSNTESAETQSPDTLPPEGRLLRNSMLCQSLDKSLRQGEMGIGSTCDFIKAVIREKSWEKRTIRTGELITLSSLRELITKPPLEGYGEKIEDVERMIANDPEALADFREAVKEQGKRNDLCSNATEVKSNRGKAYTLSRLKRETPDLFASVVRGELSANAAAVKAGWRKVKTPLELLRAAWVRANAPERLAHLTGIRDELPELWSKVSREGDQ
jgi:hypothetical protein